MFRNCGLLEQDAPCKVHSMNKTDNNGDLIKGHWCKYNGEENIHFDGDKPQASREAVMVRILDLQ